MRSETPQDVFFGADFSDVQSIGVEIVDLAQHPVADELFQLEICIQTVISEWDFRGRSLHGLP